MELLSQRDDELSGWTVFIALQFSALIPGRSTWKLSSRIFFDSALFTAEWQVLKMKNFFNKNSSLHLWIWISKYFLPGWKSRVRSLGWAADNWTRAANKFSFTKLLLPSSERERKVFHARFSDSRNRVWRIFSLVGVRDTQQRDAINVERIQIGKWFRKECLIRAIIFPWRACFTHNAFPELSP